jgi:replicative DNA helicase
MSEKKPQYQKRNQQPNSNLADINSIYGKLPPQAVEVEEAVLGALMLERDAIYKVSSIISEESFYKSEHQMIYKTLLELSDAGKQIDLLTVTMQLKDTGQLEYIGGPAAITSLTRRVASSAHIEQHARIIAEKYFSRVLIYKLTSCISKAYEDNIDELVSEYTLATQEIDDLLAGKSGMKHISTILDETRTDLEIRQEKALAGEIQGINTGLFALNEINNGWQKGELIIIAARPSMGKTAVSLNLFTKSAARNRANVCFFSLEMENLKLSKRLILSYGGIVRPNFERGTMTEGDWSAYNRADKELRTLPIYIDDTPGVDIRHISSVVRNKVRKGQCDLVVIDYLQLVETPDSYSNKTREREVAEISRELKKLAKAAGVPILLLAQLNRGIENREDKTPRLADLRESGAIEQDADMVIFPWRPAYYDPNGMDDNGNSLQNLMMFEVAKYRDGKIGSIPSKHNDDLTQFFDYNTKQFQEPIF